MNDFKNVGSINIGLGFNAELEELAHKIDVHRDKLPGWPSEKLTVIAEHSSNLYELVPDQIMDQVRPSCHAQCNLA